MEMGVLLDGIMKHTTVTTEIHLHFNWGVECFFLSNYFFCNIYAT